MLYPICTASDSNTTNADSSDQQTATNETDSSDIPRGKPLKNKSKDKTPKENLVKVNLTAEITVLDLAPLSEGSERISIEKYVHS